MSFSFRFDENSFCYNVSIQDWFPGWSEHGFYNKQPNDDGLSEQDCIEVRRHFRMPPGVQPATTPLSASYMWNDRDCNARNYFLCERAMSDGNYLLPSMIIKID